MNTNGMMNMMRTYTHNRVMAIIIMISILMRGAILTAADIGSKGGAKEKGAPLLAGTRAKRKWAIGEQARRMAK